MSPPPILIGQHYGQLLVIRRAARQGTWYYTVCLECNVGRVYHASDLRSNAARCACEKVVYEAAQ
jgi:hypothetical protein